MVRTNSPQELFRTGEFGNEDTERNQVEPQDREPFFASLLQKTLGVVSICEMGANRGYNWKRACNTGNHST